MQSASNGKHEAWEFWDFKSVYLIVTTDLWGESSFLNQMKIAAQSPEIMQAQMVASVEDQVGTVNANIKLKIYPFYSTFGTFKSSRQQIT